MAAPPPEEANFIFNEDVHDGGLKPGPSMCQVRAECGG